jgi:hypothetical protein
MNLSRRRLGPVLAGVAGILACRAAAAQTAPEPRLRWQLNAPQAGWCIHFLLEPREAAKDLPRGAVPVPARSASGLPAPVQRTVAEEPEYGAWVPSTLCLYVTQSITAANRQYDRGDGGQPIAFLYWGVAATHEGGGSGASSEAFRMLGTNSSALRRAMEIQSLPLEHVDIALRPIAETDDQRFQFKLHGATVFFDGHPRPDSSLSLDEPRTRAAYRGNSNTVWLVDLTLHPTSVSTLAGALRILGKHGLAKALDRSPVRFLGPSVAGGDGEVAFYR